MNISQKVKKLGFRKDTYIVIGSGVLEALDLRKANDVDLAVDETTYEKFLLKDHEKKIHEDGTIELLFDDYGIKTSWDSKDGSDNLKDLLSDSIEIGEVSFVSPRRLLEWKKRMKREKDKKDIQLLEEYLKE